MIHKDSWSWTRRTFMKSSVAGALLAGYKLLWPSVAQAGSLPPRPNAQATKSFTMLRRIRLVWRD